QYLTDGFPVLSAGPTPRVDTDKWQFSIIADGQRHEWSWSQMQMLPSESVTVDIHCVTKWSKFHTPWRGVALDTLFAHVESAADYALVHSYGGYTTNLPIADLLDGQSWVAYEYDGQPLPPEHGGPARLLVPHLYFWKSAKWVRAIELTHDDQPGFWETAGYHNYGDPWREQRYWGD
ncbi:MAG TPA: molybdopterin-dependent oxidoreductase, partial [Micromonosporaceae bacterium]|nr:molybdopterin-dependent oxidoreductase [Micromonosporaceae bacterium]